MTLFFCHHSLKLQALTWHKKSTAWVWPFRSICDDSWINLLICFGRLRAFAAPGSSLLLLILSRLGESHDTTTTTQSGLFPLILTKQLNKAAFFLCRIIAKHIFIRSQFEICMTNGGRAPAIKRRAIEIEILASCASIWQKWNINGENNGFILTFRGNFHIAAAGSKLLGNRCTLRSKKLVDRFKKTSAREWLPSIKGPTLNILIYSLWGLQNVNQAGKCL